MGNSTPPSGSEDTVARTLGSSASPGSASLSLPVQIGEYMLVELLGEGAMGRVYKADQFDPVRRQVAIKFLAAEQVDADLLARFEAEGHALARMSHPCIARIYGAGTSTSGHPYLVMEYVSGPTLLDYCDAHRLDLDARLHLFGGICAALAHAHQKGIIHRDIKPSNILVTEQEGEATPKVIDFGLAKALVGHLADRNLETHVGTVLGTPAFMSPEQASLTGQEVDTRSDIYALGLVLYQMLTGALPFKRVGEQDSTIEQVLRAVREDDPMRPSARLAAGGPEQVPAGLDGSVGKALREDLDWIILKCLAKRPEDRYQSANDLAADLERYHRHQPVQARRSSLGYLVSKSVRRYRGRLLVAAGVIVLGVALGGGWLNSRAESAAQARAAQEFGQTVQRMDSLLRVAHLLPMHDVSAVRGQVRTMVDDLARRKSSMTPWSRAVADYAIGRGLLDLGQPDKALDSLKAAWSAGYREPEAAYALGVAYGRVYQKEKYKLASVTDADKHKIQLADLQKAYLEPALAHLRQGAAAGAQSASYGQALIAFYEKDFARARVLAEKAVDDNPSLYEAVVLIGQTWTEQASNARRAGQRERALAAYNSAEQAYHRAATIGRSDMTPYLAQCSMASDHLRLIMYGSGGDSKPVVEAGLAACEKAIAINPESGSAHARMANLRLVDAQILEGKGENPLPIYHQVLDAAAHAMRLNPDGALAYMVSGTASQRIALYQLHYTHENPRAALARAGEFYQQAIAHDKDRSDVYNELGNVYSIRGEYSATHDDGDPMPDLLAAVDYYKTGLKMQHNEPVMLSNLGFNYTIIADYLVRQKRDPTAWFDKAFAVYDDILARNANMMLARINLASTAFKRGKYAESSGGDPLPWWHQAVSEFKKVLTADPNDQLAWAGLAGTYTAQANLSKQSSQDAVAKAQLAIKACDKANAVRPTADVWSIKVKALRVLAEHEKNPAEAKAWRQQAEQASRKAQALSPKDEKAKAQ